MSDSTDHSSTPSSTQDCHHAQTSPGHRHSRPGCRNAYVWNKKNEHQVIRDTRNGVSTASRPRATHCLHGDAKNSAYVVATRPGWKNVESADTALKTMQFGREGFHDTYLNHAVKLSTVNINNTSTMDFAIHLLNSPSLQARADNENKEYLEKLPEVDELHSAGLELIRQRIGVNLVKEISKGKDGQTVFGMHVHLPYSIPYLASIGKGQTRAFGYETKLRVHLNPTGEVELRIEHVFSSGNGWRHYPWATTTVDARDVVTPWNLWCHGMKNSTANAKSEPFTHGYADTGLHLSCIDMKDIPAYGMDINVTKVHHAVDLRELERMASDKVQGFQKSTEEVDLLFMGPYIQTKITMFFVPGRDDVWLNHLGEFMLAVRRLKQS
ncbi:hypothetical protein PG990_011753 [Apiospora arundinis]